MKITETCRCGASLTVEDDQRADVTTAMQTWRTTHPCLQPGQTARNEPQPAGSTSGLIGFTPSIYRGDVVA